MDGQVAGHRRWGVCPLPPKSDVFDALALQLLISIDYLTSAILNQTLVLQACDGLTQETNNTAMLY